MSGRSLESVSENTETNCWFSIFALALEFLCAIPLCFKGDVPDESHLNLKILAFAILSDSRLRLIQQMPNNEHLC